MTNSKLKSLLEKAVHTRANPFMTYGRFGTELGLGSFAPAWANRKVLDAAAQECKRDKKIKRLDLTFLLRSSQTHYPSVIDGEPFDEANPVPQITRARDEAARII